MEAPRRRTEFSLASPDKDTGSGTSDTSAEPSSPAEAAPIPDSEMSFPKKAIATRTQSLQSVLSAASLKSLTQMTPAAPPGAPPQRTLHRNPSTISSSSRTASRDFQSFIQAPVLTSVSTLRQSEVEIGQHSPFGDAISNDNNGTTTLDYSASQRESRSVAPPPPTTGTAPPDLPRQLFSQPSETASTTAQDPQASSSKTRPRQPSDDTQIAENLTLNALKKLSMSPLPMVSHGGVKRVQSTPSATATAPQMTPAQPNNNAVSMPGSRTTTPAPYQPATVDLSSFPSLTRQSSSSRVETPVASEPEPAATPRNQSTISSVLSQQQSRFPANQPPPQQVAAGTGAGNRPPSVVSTLPRRDYHAQQAQHLNKQMKPLLQGTQSAPNAATAATSTSNNSTNGSKVSTPSRVANPYFSQGTPVQRSVSVPSRQLQSIQGLRSPMYVPAVLRVTQNPMIPTPDSDDYLPSHPSSSPESVVSSKPSTPLMPSTPLQGPQSRSYDDIMRAPPTRKHWLKDESVDKCMIESCPRTFNFFERRHHCRKCGGIFCKEHTSHLLYINHLAQFTTGGRGTLSKVCDMCIDEYSQFIVAEFGPSSVPTVTPSTSNNGGAATPRYRQPLSATPEEQQDPNKPLAATHRPVINGKSITTKEAAVAAGCGHFDDQAPRDQLVGSVPANWSWSSF